MATQPIRVDLDLNQNEIQNAVTQNLGSAPENPKAGQEYFNTNTRKKYIFDGTNWVDETSQGGGSYSAGTGIDSTALASNVIAVNTSVIATQTDIADLISLGDLSIANSSSNYLTYDNTTGEFGANVDTTVTASSTNLVTSGAVQTAINNALIGGMVYKGVWTATGQTDYSSITLPVKAGYMYLVSGSATITAGGKTIEWNTDDYLVINTDVSAGGTITDVRKIDNTESSDIVRLSATQTLTNKTIDADDNTVQNLEVDNFKSGVVVTTIRPSTTASDSNIATELSIAKALEGISKKITINNPALTSVSGVVTWTVSNTLGISDVLVQVFEISSGTQVLSEVSISSSNIIIKMNSENNISADTYKVVIIG